jgi:hypothetical protein
LFVLKLLVSSSKESFPVGVHFLSAPMHILQLAGVVIVKRSEIRYKVAGFSARVKDVKGYPVKNDGIFAAML